MLNLSECVWCVVVCRAVEETALHNEQTKHQISQLQKEQKGASASAYKLKAACANSLRPHNTSSVRPHTLVAEGRIR